MEKTTETIEDGWSSMPLIEEGEEQAKIIGNYLKEKQEEYKLEKIISSDLLRARQTADIINSFLDLPIEYTDKLREMNNGDIAGMLNAEVERLYPGLYYNTLEIDERYPGGESPIEFFERIKKNFFDIISENENVENLLIVTHSGVINILYHIIKNEEWSNKKKGYPAANLGIHRIVYKDGKMEFDIENFKIVQ